jgi:hypothetical protein
LCPFLFISVSLIWLHTSFWNKNIVLYRHSKCNEKKFIKIHLVLTPSFGKICLHYNSHICLIQSAQLWHLSSRDEIQGPKISSFFSQFSPICYTCCLTNALFSLFFHPFSHICNIGHVNYRLQFIYYNRTYTTWTSTQYNIMTILINYTENNTLSPQKPGMYMNCSSIALKMEHPAVDHSWFLCIYSEVLNNCSMLHTGINQCMFTCIFHCCWNATMVRTEQTEQVAPTKLTLHDT